MVEPLIVTRRKPAIDGESFSQLEIEE